MDLKQDEWYDAFATSTAEARKRKRSVGDDLEMAGVARAGDLNRRRTGIGATPKRCDPAELIPPVARIRARP